MSNNEKNEHFFNHVNGIAPYNGVVAVVQNSSLLSEAETEWTEKNMQL